MSSNDSSECTCSEALLLDLDKHIISYGDTWKHLLNHPGFKRFCHVLSGRFHPVHEECSCPLIHDNEISVLKHSKYQMHVFDVCPCAHT